jgi:hypothetical protein
MLEAKRNGRKFALSKYTLIATFILFTLQGIGTLVLALCGLPFGFSLLTPEVFCTLVIGTLGTYGAANATSKFAWSNQKQQPTVSQEELDADVL